MIWIAIGWLSDTAVSAPASDFDKDLSSVCGYLELVQCAMENSLEQGEGALVFGGTDRRLLMVYIEED